MELEVHFGSASVYDRVNIEAVRLVRDRGVSVAKASRDLRVHGNVIRKWIKDFDADPSQAFLGHRHMKPEQAEIERVKREVQKPKAEIAALDACCRAYGKCD